MSIVNPDRINSYYGACGSLLTDRLYIGAQKQDEKDSLYYSNGKLARSWFIAESMTETMAQAISTALGFKYRKGL